MTQARDLADVIAGANTLPSASMPTGSVLQVVQATSGTALQTTTVDTWHKCRPTVTITPKSTSNKVLITHTGAVMCFEQTFTVMYRILRDTTEIVQIGRVYSDVASGDWTGHILALEYLDSPSTTSATTYTIQVQISNAGQLRHNNLTGSFTPKAITIAKEIAG